MPHPKLDAAGIQTLPLSERRNLLRFADQTSPPASSAELTPALNEKIERVARRVRAARSKGAAVMLAYGAHLVKNYAAPLVRELVRGGHVTHLATQGAGVIHDWEFAFQGSSGESVRENTAVGRFGCWEETGRWINLAVAVGATEGLGFGEAVGRLIVDDGLKLPSAQELGARVRAEPDHELAGAWADLLWLIGRFQLPQGRVEVVHPHKEYSILAGAYEANVPLTVHPGIGYDIIVNHPLYHGGAIGRAALTDARVYGHSVDHLDDGVYLSVGSAIMSPQVFEKALSAANNLRAQAGKEYVRNHYLAVVDLQDAGGWDWSVGEPPADNPAYYLRYCKTFNRMGGRLDYLQCDNRDFLAGLLSRL